MKSERLDIAFLSSGEWRPGPPEQGGFAGIAIDSRRLFQPASTLFFCLRGPRHDGHAFIDEAYAAGVRSFVVDHWPDTWLPQAHYLLVPDTLRALQQLVGRYRQQLPARVTALTGSNGKTSVKEWLYTLLREHYPVMRSPRSYNSQVGVALSLALATPEHQQLLIEAGISRPGEMAHLAAMIRPDTGILTNLGSAHDEGFANREEKLQEKLLLFQGVTQLLAPATLVSQYPLAFAPYRRQLVTWSEGEPADLIATHWEEQPEGQTIYYQFRERTDHYFLPHPCTAARHNSLTCLLYALLCGLDTVAIHAGMARLPALTMRLETREGWHNNLVINDHYNADLEALRLALAFYTQRKGTLDGWLILSDLDESGLQPEALLQELSTMLLQPSVQRISFIGTLGPALAERLPEGISMAHYPDTMAFLQARPWADTHHTAILIKGARRFAFEEISRALVRYSHRTVLEISLSALSHNLAQYSRLLSPATRTLVMVKASAYGGGSAEIARWLDLQRVGYLGVAYADEGVELRRAGIALPILVMNPDEAAFPLILSHRLEPEIHSLIQLRQFLHFLSPGDPVVPIHIKLETGMHRLGFQEEELSELIRLIRESGQLQVASIFSHLAGGDDPALDAFTHQQAARFSALAHYLEEQLGYRPLRHLLNSAGTARFPEYHFDMVRLGIGLYGLENSPSLREQLKPAMALRSRITRIHQVPADASVGYGCRGRSQHPRTIATVAIGYADGLLRLAGEGRFAVHIRNKPAPTVGSICMDMCMVDVSGIPDAAVGDEVVLFDQEHALAVLAEALQTIPYEVLTNISSRVPRVYIED